MSPVVVTFVVLVLAVIAFISNRVPLGVVAVGVVLSLWATGVLSLQQALAGFGDPTVIFIATLFIVSEALDATGVTAWVGRQIVDRGGERRSTLLVVIGLLVAGLSSLISINGAVAALTPVVVVVAARVRIAPSRLLMPLAFSAHAGSLLTLTGTPVNIIVSEAAADAVARPFGFFEFALAGLPLLLGTLVIVVLAGDRLLPEREPAVLPADAADQARVLRERYALAEDVPLATAATGVTEVVVPPGSALIGVHVFPGETTVDGDLVVLAARRAGDDLTDRDARLRAGDALVLQGRWEHLERSAAGADVLAVHSPETVRRAVPLGRGAKRAIGVTLAMVVLLATGLVPPVIAGLLAVVAIILTGTLRPAQAYRGVSWTTVVLIAGMIPLSTAFTTTGAADMVADGLLGVVGNASPHLALLALCAMTVVLGQLISNMATVLIMLPIATVLASDLHVSVLPFMMALAVAGAASFLTPVATPANTMVMEPAGYRFTDYWKLGLPLLLLFLAVAVGWVPVIWPF